MFPLQLSTVQQQTFKPSTTAEQHTISFHLGDDLVFEKLGILTCIPERRCVIHTS